MLLWEKKVLYHHMVEAHNAIQTGAEMQLENCNLPVVLEC